MLRFSGNLWIWDVEESRQVDLARRSGFRAWSGVTAKQFASSSISEGKGSFIRSSRRSKSTNTTQTPIPGPSFSLDYLLFSYIIIYTLLESCCIPPPINPSQCLLLREMECSSWYTYKYSHVTRSSIWLASHDLSYTLHLAVACLYAKSIRGLLVFSWIRKSSSTGRSENFSTILANRTASSIANPVLSP